MKIQGQPSFKLMVLCLAVPMFIACNPEEIAEEACEGAGNYIQTHPDVLRDAGQCFAEGALQGVKNYVCDEDPDDILRQCIRGAIGPDYSECLEEALWLHLRDTYANRICRDHDNDAQICNAGSMTIGAACMGAFQGPAEQDAFMCCNAASSSFLNVCRAAAKGGDGLTDADCEEASNFCKSKCEGCTSNEEDANKCKAACATGEAVCKAEVQAKPQPGWLPSLPTFPLLLADENCEENDLKCMVNL